MTEYIGNHPIRRIRIQGHADDTRGYMVSVYNADTGDSIGNIRSILVDIHAEGHTMAKIGYHAVDEQGKSKDKYDEDLTVELDDPDIDITAMADGRDVRFDDR